MHKRCLRRRLYGPRGLHRPVLRLALWRSSALAFRAAPMRRVPMRLRARPLAFQDRGDHGRDLGRMAEPRPLLGRPRVARNGRRPGRVWRESAR